MDGELSVNCLR